MSKFMKIAIQQAKTGLNANMGGPFGAVIVKNNEIISKACNEVIKTNDPTAHAEILAIRRAAERLKRFDLSDCELYTSCEPCPMCLGAVYWARIKKIYYGCTKVDAADIGFIDKEIYDILKGDITSKSVDLIEVDRKECLKLFNEWNLKVNKIVY